MSLPLIMAAVDTAGQIYGGYSAYKSGKTQRALYNEQAAFAIKDSLKEARQVEREGERFAQDQGISFISSGLELGGSNLLIMKETRLLVEEESKFIKERGQNESKLLRTQGSIAANEGKAQLIGSIVNGASTMLSAKGVNSGKNKPVPTK